VRSWQFSDLLSAKRPIDSIAKVEYKDVPAFAAFLSDIKNETQTLPPSTPPHPEWVGVKEPISTACNAVTSGNPYGMSGNGAMRWARGHECSYPYAIPVPGNPPGGPWSVIWTRVEQILFHYYTGVHLRNADHDNDIISPDRRWNPLDLRWAGNSGEPATRSRAYPYTKPTGVGWGASRRKPTSCRCGCEFYAPDYSLQNFDAHSQGELKIPCRR
jgi:hypothetical protein